MTRYLTINASTGLGPVSLLASDKTVTACWVAEHLSTVNLKQRQSAMLRRDKLRCGDPMNEKKKLAMSNFVTPWGLKLIPNPRIEASQEVEVNGYFPAETVFSIGCFPTLPHLCPT